MSFRFCRNARDFTPLLTTGTVNNGWAIIKDTPPIRVLTNSSNVPAKRYELGDSTASPNSGGVISTVLPKGMQEDRYDIYLYQKNANPLGRGIQVQINEGVVSPLLFSTENNVTYGWTNKYGNVLLKGGDTVNLKVVSSSYWIGFRDMCILKAGDSPPDYVPIGTEGDRLEGVITVKYLIKSQNKIYTLFEGEWIETPLAEPLAQEDYEQYGMDNLEDVPMSFLNQLEEFEILTWTDSHEIVEKKSQGVEETIDEGKLFVTTIDNLIKVVNVEII